MKKLTMTLALVLCLILCAFAFASCGKKKNTASTTAPDATTAAPAGTTAGEPTATPTTAPATEPPHVHVPESDYQVDVEPTCSTPGEKSLYCEECGALIEGSTVEIPVDPEAHVVENWTIVEPTLFEPVGSKVGTCLMCEQEINIVLNWELKTYSSQDPSFEYKEGVEFAFHKNVDEIRGDKSFAPTEDDPDGNDLWFEYSLLYNKTLYDHDYPGSLSEIRIFCFRESTNRSTYRGFYYLYLRNNGDGFKTSTDCPFRGHIDYSTYDTTATPPENCAYDLSELGNTLNGRLIGRYKAGWDPKRTESPYLWDSEYQTLNGWHRLGFRYHQEAAIVEGAVVYSGYTELYIDGVLCWKIDSNFKPGHKDSLVTKNLLLWTAEIDENDPTKLVYTNHDSMMVGMRMDNFTQASKEVLFAFDDARWTCGDGFAVPVVRVENPKPVPTTLKEGVEDVIAMYFAKPGCVHEAEDEWTVVKEAASLLEDGVKGKFCKHCGECMETEAISYEPSINVWTNASSGTYNNDKVSVETVLGDKHFYPTDDNATGNDLLIEYSILWNESMLNFVGSQKPHITARIGGQDGGTSNNICYWSPVSDNDDADCKFAGGFEYGTMRTSEEGNPYPQMTKPVGDSIDEFPNIGGANNGDGTPQGETQWGWHRVQIRLHIDVTNEAALKADTTAGATKAAYKCTTTIYIDGVLVSILSSDSMTNSSNSYDNKLFTAASNGEGGITYTDIAGDKWIHPMRFNYIQAKTGTTIYMVYGDLSVTCGKDFVQNVEKVLAPTSATFEVAEGVTVPADMWFKLK